jgi:DNA-directed RNA polymerase specialized sigma24 family protein
MDALIGEEVPSWAIKASTRNYPDTSRLDEATAMLCALCRDMSPRDQNTIIYDGRSSKARAPADWWDHHQEEDAREAERKAAAARKEQLKQQALNKLTPEERAALLG